MHEMLGNQYFMARNYEAAAIEFEKHLTSNPNSVNAQKKLIISLTQIKKYDQAITLFTNFIKDNIDRIIETDPIKDDCPCPELVNNLEKITNGNSHSFITNQVLGVLWLYCDIYKSLEYFEKANEINPSDQQNNAILVSLKSKIAQLKHQ